VGDHNRWQSRLPRMIFEERSGVERSAVSHIWRKERARYGHSADK
jgi:hypothetical protein